MGLAGTWPVIAARETGVSQTIELFETAQERRATRSARTGPVPVTRSLPPTRSFFGELAEVVRDVWAARDLVHQLTLRDIRIRYKQAVMGFAWAILMPVLVVGSGMLVRFAMSYVSGRPVELSALGGIAIKSLPWAFFVGTIGLATASLLANMNLLTKIYFPREVLPLSTTLAQLFDSSIGTVVLLLALPFLGATLSPQLLWAGFQVLCLFSFTLGAALFLSCANLFFRDVKYIVQVLLTFGIFITPVFIEPVMLGQFGVPLMVLNPLAPILEGLRLSVIEGHNLLQPLVEVNSKGQPFLTWTPWYLLLQSSWAFGGLVLSLRIFRRASIRFAEYI